MRDPLTYLSLAKEVVVGIVAAAGAIAAHYRLRSARSWPIIYGRVEFCEAHTKDGGKWRVEIYYSYQPAGQYYSGQQTVMVDDERRAGELSSRLKGQNVTVRYSPRSPADSLLLPEEQMSFLEGALSDPLTRQRKILQFLKNNQPIWKAENHPELAEGAIRWVQTLRSESEQRIARGKKSQDMVADTATHPRRSPR